MINRKLLLDNTLFLLFIFIFFANQMYGQSYKIFTGPLASVNTNLEKLGKNVIGTPYLNTNFISATIGDSQEVIPIRYDAYLDKLEVLVDDKVYEVPKIDRLSTFNFKSVGATIIYLKDDNGYYFRIVNGKNQLLKKEKIKLENVNSSIEPNSMIREAYSKFEKQRPTYFIKIEDNNLIKLTKKTDELMNALPANKKEAVKDFIKTNKIKMTEELDLIKLVTFLNK